VRGFPLEGYGVLFDVEVPSLESAPLWSFRTLDQNALGLESALNALRSHINSAGDANLQQALKRIELQVEPMARTLSVAQPTPAGLQPAAGSAAATTAATTTDATGSAAADDLSDPAQAYRAEIKNALMDAMLEHSRGLGIAPTEWLVIAARGNYERPPLAPADSEAETVVIRVRGSDLTAFLGGQISHEEARKRMDVKVF
jgi:hypothetical protein